MASAHRSPNEPLTAFREHLTAIRREVDTRLNVLWEETLTSLEGYGKSVVVMGTAARDLTLRGGKRFRAAMLAAAFSGVAPRASVEPALSAGVAIELLQSYLLIQDDWMDDDPIRRGGPAAHAALAEVFGDPHVGACSALLASDLTWGLAVQTLGSIRINAQRKLQAIQLLCAIHQDVVAGQALDVLGRAEDVERMHQLKTGSYTVRGPLVLGATLAGAPQPTMDALNLYAQPLGVAFQLRDDLLGAFADEADTGKQRGNDLRTGKRTSLLAAADKRLSPEDQAALMRAFGRADATDEEVIAATDALERCGARAAVEDRLRSLCAQASTLAAELPLAPRARKILIGATSALLPP